MGAGKTTVAGTLASRLRVRAADSDHEVERRCGTSVAQIFAGSGEPAFRALELEAVTELLGDPRFGVVSLGGGAFMTREVREQCAAHGARVFYLHARPEVLLERLDTTAREARPLLADDALETLERLYDQRDPVYRTAGHIIEVSGKYVSEIVDEIIEETWCAAEDP
jgi:shikimate kinase